MTENTERPETRRATGMGVPGEFESDRDNGAGLRFTAGAKLDAAAGKLHNVADRAAVRDDPVRRAAPAAHELATGIERTARYIQSEEFRELKEGVEDRIRRHPLPALGIAFAAGLLLRKVL